MKKFFLKFIKKLKINDKKKPFFPYEGKVKSAYFYYSGLFLFFGLWVCVFSLFIIINLSLNHEFIFGSDLQNINITITPILNLILIVISWFLLLFAPKEIYKSPKKSSIMFYFSFWFLVIAVVLNASLQLGYINNYGKTLFYNWINFDLAKILIVISVFALFFIQVFFWIMRRKFAFMPSDYEIYQNRSEKKKAKKDLKQQKKITEKARKREC